MDRTRVGRLGSGILGLCLAVTTFSNVSPAAAESPYSGGPTTTTSGSRTESGAQASVGTGSQTVIPTSGRSAHRGRGAASVTCEFRAVDVTNPLGSGGEAGNPHEVAAGTHMWRSCFDAVSGRRVEGPTLYTSTGPAAGAAPDVMARLVESALANVDVDLPEPRFSPPTETIPNFETWLWVDGVTVRTASASAGGVTVSVRAEPTRSRFEVAAVAGVPSVDDGVVVTCTGTPPRFDPGRGRQRTTCSHRFAAPTRDLTVDVTTTWALRWSASTGEGGDLGTIDRTATVPYRVQVKETVIRSGP